jgi:hypothetical protein
MPTERIREIVRWLDAAAEPVLVQLTEAAYEALRDPWKLSGSRSERGERSNKTARGNR